MSFTQFFVQCHSKVISALLSLTYRLIAMHNMQASHERQ